MSFEHPNRNNESMIDVERDIMGRPSERNTTNLDLRRMKMILDVMGHPEESFRVVHITGTNGKGSTARMVESICRAYGMRTGLYTSPHLEHVNERIAIDGQQLSDDDFVDAWDQVRDLIAIVDMKMEELGKPKMSFFEVLTAMAIWKFADAPVDVAIVEAGMGGRRDASGRRSTPGRGGRRGGRQGRPLGRHQRARCRCRHHRSHRHGPYGVAGRHRRTDRLRKGRHHQARLHRRHRASAA